MYIYKEHSRDLNTRDANTRQNKARHDDTKQGNKQDKVG